MGVGTFLRSSGVLLQGSCTHYQVRNFRFGLWSSYLDSNLEKESRRRHRVIKHKYLEAVNSRLSWDRHFPGYPKAYGLKGFMCSAWNNQNMRLGGGWANVDELRKPREMQDKDPIAGTAGMQERYQSNIRDIQDRLRVLRSSMEAYRARPISQRQKFDDNSSSSAKFTSSRSTTCSRPLMYDSPAPSEICENEGSRRRFQTQSGSQEYDIDPITNRKVYKNVPNTNLDSTYESTEIPVKTFDSYRSHFHTFQTPDSNPEATIIGDLKGSAETLESLDPVQEGLKDYDSKANYSNGAFYDVSGCGIDYGDSTQFGLKDYDEKLRRKASEAGLSEDKAGHASSIQNPKKVAWDTDVHKEIRHYEYKISRPKRLVEAIQEYEANRPKHSNILFGGRYAKQPPLLQAIEDFEHSRGEAKDQALSDGTLDPLLKAIYEYRESIQGELLFTLKHDKSNDENHTDVMSTLEIIHSIDEYQSSIRQALLPDTQVPLSLSENSGLEDYDHKVDYSRGKCRSIFSKAQEDTTEDLDLLRASDVRAASGILKDPQKETEEEKSAKREELEQAFKDSQDHGPEEELAAVNKVKECRSRNFERSSKGDSTIKASEEGDLTQNLKASPRDIPRNLTGESVCDFPEEFETSWQKQDSGTLMPKFSSSQQSETNVKSINPYHEPELTGVNIKLSKIETTLDRGVHHEAHTAATMNKQEHGMSSKLQGYDDLSKPMSSYGMLRDSDRDTRVSEKVDAKFAHNIRDINESECGSIESNHRQAPEDHNNTRRPLSITQDTKEHECDLRPNMYMILAYDPTMQSVSAAETTSIVEDVSSPLTPAEVLLRLSNPAKFFPHFQPLQSQGYEIVSGSGDVLVFRKVRAGQALGTKYEDKISVDQKYRKKVTNPIDGMQGNPIATTGDFASPTGFVNYDLPRGSEPPFKSNIDVRREEPIFSGKSSWQSDENNRSRKKSRGKKMFVSAVWVAGCCYAVGVVTEFFKTGGIDGIGPQGF